MQISSIPLTPTALAASPVDPAAPTTDPITPPADPIDPVAPAPTEPASRFLQKLASGHFNPVADLRHRMHRADEIAAADLSLPEPAAPHGNGKAYAKFLAAYRAMTPAAPAAEPAVPMDPASVQPAPSQPTVLACLDTEG